MGYVLKNGKRYYQDEDGTLLLDNVSQEEADRREWLSSNSISKRVTSYTGTSHNSVSGTGAGTMPNRECVPWIVIILIVILLMFVVAFFHNQNYISPAEKAISDYMDSVTNSN